MKKMVLLFSILFLKMFHLSTRCLCRGKRHSAGVEKMCPASRNFNLTRTKVFSCLDSFCVPVDWLNMHVVGPSIIRKLGLLTCVWINYFLQELDLMSLSFLSKLNVVKEAFGANKLLCET